MNTNLAWIVALYRDPSRLKWKRKLLRENLSLGLSFSGWAVFKFRSVAIAVDQLVYTICSRIWHNICDYSNCPLQSKRNLQSSCCPCSPKVCGNLQRWWPQQQMLGCSHFELHIDNFRNQMAAPPPQLSCSALEFPHDLTPQVGDYLCTMLHLVLVLR